MTNSWSMMLRAIRPQLIISTLLILRVSGQYQPYAYQDYYNVPQDYSNLPNYYGAPVVQDYAIANSLSPEYGVDYSEDYSVGRFPDGTMVEGALSRHYESQEEGDDYSMVKIPKINDSCLKRDCKGKKNTKYTDKYMAGKNYDFLQRNRIISKLVKKAKKEECRVCLCNLADEYAHYTGKINQESGICEPHLGAQHCISGPIAMARRRKTACILPAPINTYHGGYRRKSGKEKISSQRSKSGIYRNILGSMDYNSGRDYISEAIPVYAPPPRPPANRPRYNQATRDRRRNMFKNQWRIMG